MVHFKFSWTRTTSTPAGPEELTQTVSFGADKNRQTLYERYPLTDNLRSIRILTLMPYKRSEDSEIRCKIGCESLKSEPVFEALSYCCGADEKQKKREIWVDEYKVKVLPNLYHALKQLRQSMAKRRLWTDAICIDQQNMDERKAQVSIIRDIFASAKRTIGWLGPATDESKLIFDNCQQLTDFCGPEEVARDFKAAWRSRTLDDQTASKFTQLTNRNFAETYWTPRSVEGKCFEGLHESIVPALVEVLERGYFSRVWILQEAAVSKKVVLQCGIQEMPLVPLLFYATLLGTVAGHGLTMRPGSGGAADNCWHERSQSFMLLAAATHMSLPNAPTLSLSTVLSSFRRFDCTEVQDKLFTMYTLAPDEVKTLNLKPDYRRDPVDVFVDVASKILCQLRDLSILEIPRGNGKLRSRLPSWIPDWTDTSRFGVGLTPESQTERTLSRQTYQPARARWRDLQDQQEARQKSIAGCEKSHRFLRTFQTEIKDLTPVQWFQAAGESEPSNVSIDKQLLSVDGLVLDKVKGVSDLLQELSAPPVDTRHLFSHWLRIFSTLVIIQDWWQQLTGKEASSKGNYPTGESRKMAFAQTVCAGSLPGRHSFANHWVTNEQFLKSFEKWMESWALGQDQIKFFRPMAKMIMPNSLRKLIEVNFQGWVTSRYSGRDVDGLAHAGAPTYHRRIGYTQKGYFALLPAATEVDDNIVILKGGKLPLVMRPHGTPKTNELSKPLGETKTNELIGEAYVHGVMFGEAWDASQCETIRIS